MEGAELTCPQAVSLGACSAPPVLERAADVDRERSREVARGIAGVAPGPGEATRENGFTKMAEEHEQLAQAIERRQQQQTK